MTLRPTHGTKCSDAVFDLKTQSLVDKMHQRRRLTRTRMPVCLLNQKSWVFQSFEGSSNLKSKFCKAKGTSLCISLSDI